MRVPNRTPTFEGIALVERLRQYMMVIDPDHMDLHGRRWKQTKYRWLGSLEKCHGRYRDEAQLKRALDHIEAWRDDKWCPRVNSMSQLIGKLGVIREHALRMRGRTPEMPQEPSFDVAGSLINWSEQRHARAAAVSPEQVKANIRAAKAAMSKLSQRKGA